MVYVLNKDEKPLMPTKRHGKVRRWLKEGKAVVIHRTPFTIQLTFETKEYIQDIVLGIDAGSKIIGISAVTEKEEVYSSETVLRTDVVELLSDRRECRRARRNRKTRYRKARFDNRRRKDGWLAPSIRHKIDSHLRLVRKVFEILPITSVVVEVASFDIQKINNPDIKSAGYQQGEQLDFWNVREYVLHMDGHICRHCSGKSGDRILDVHHIESRKTGGDAPNNLTTLCGTCHDLHHKDKIVLNAKRGRSFRDAAFMGIMRWAFYGKLKELYENVSLTFGYITKNTRIRNSLEKSHRTDARCITGNPGAKPLGYCFRQKFVRKSNRSLHKMKILKGGKRKTNKAERVVLGFRLYDKVLFNDRVCFVFGRRISGYFDLRLLNGEKISASANVKRIKLLEIGGTLLTERRKA